jgi:hypothetical protein
MFDHPARRRNRPSNISFQQAQTSEVDRSNKAAAPPAHEAGEAITTPASGGGSQGLTGVGSGKGGETESK